MKMTEPKLLSECGTKLVVDDTEGERYQVEIDPGDFLVVRAGATTDHAGAKFTHPNIAASVRTIHEFKHYRKNGSKFWTARAGVDHYFVIPRNEVKMLPEKGYSYVPAEINGVKVHFNVSGGTANGWTDWLHAHASISVNHRVRDLKRLAEAAVRDSPMEPITVKPLEPDQETKWRRLAARVSKGLVEKIARLVENGKHPVVKLMPGYGYAGRSEAEAVEVHRRYRKVPVDPVESSLGDHKMVKAWRMEQTGAPKSLVLSFVGCRVRTKLSQIDWAATAEANGIAA